MQTALCSSIRFRLSCEPYGSVAAHCFNEKSGCNRRDFSIAAFAFGTGSGVVFDDEGNIVTNAHVVYGAKQLFVAIEGGGILEAKLVGVDPVSDLAVVKLTDIGEVSLPKANFETSDNLSIGQGVVAIGFPSA